MSAFEARHRNPSLHTKARSIDPSVHSADSSQSCRSTEAADTVPITISPSSGAATPEATVLGSGAKPPDYPTTDTDGQRAAIVE